MAGESSSKWRLPVGVFFRDARHVLKWDSIGKEIMGIAVPAALGVAADPLASLIDTAFIGHIGAVELAAAGVSIAVFNQASRITIFPLVSITTSFVAQEDTIANMTQGPSKKRYIASASTALIMGIILGLLQAIFLIFMATTLLGVMGVKQDSAMMGPAEKYLVTRAFGAPAVLLTLAMQGIFRGFKDTTTPLYVILVGYSLNVALDPILIFVCGMGITGAALAHVISQYLMALTLFLILITKVNLMPPTLKHLQFARFLKNGFYLLTRVIAVTFCVTLAASLAARLGATPMAAFQTCLQVWLTSSLLADGLAIAIQAILASAFTENDYEKATAAATRVLQMSFLLGLALSFLVGLGLYFGAPLFSTDLHVLHLIRIGLPFVAATQPINSLSFVFDGVNFGACDFVYSAYSLVLVAIASVPALIFLSKTHGFVGLWIALTIYMTLRAFAGVWRMGTGTGPWSFLRGPRFVQI